MSSSTAPAPTPRRILVVDDNVDAADSLVALLELEGHTAQMVHDGRAAVPAALALLPDLAFIDIGMPGMNGYEVAAAMRALPALRGTVLVALSGWGAPKDRQRALDAGFDQHLTKPAELDAIYGAVAALDQRQP